MAETSATKLDISNVKVDATTELHNEDTVQMPPRTVQDEFFAFHYETRAIFNQAEALHLQTREKVELVMKDLNQNLENMLAKIVKEQKEESRNRQDQINELEVEIKKVIFEDLHVDMGTLEVHIQDRIEEEMNELKSEINELKSDMEVLKSMLRNAL